jgi:hypothetical protein
VHIGNSDLLPEGSINFSKRWQQFNIVENMKRFKKGQVDHNFCVGTCEGPSAVQDVLSVKDLLQFRMFACEGPSAVQNVLSVKGHLHFRMFCILKF